MVISEPVSRATIVRETAASTRWWLGQRLKKIQDASLEALRLNPLLVPFLMALHNCKSREELAGITLNQHLMTGHATGLGKWLDEKLLPRVFGTTKLTAAARKETPSYGDRAFSEIDHVLRSGPRPTYLSLKTSRWATQLTGAVQMNASFSRLVDMKQEGKLDFERIVVGVTYGTQGDLTDKFDLMRGLEGRTSHGVRNLTNEVQVLVGQDFWAWLNHGEAATQKWVLEGIDRGIEESRDKLEAARGFLATYREAVQKHLSSHYDNGVLNSQRLLASTN